MRSLRAQFSVYVALAVLAAYLAQLFAPCPLAASELRRTAIVRAVEGARWAVVNIQGQKTVANEGAASEGSRQVQGMGTGVVIDPRGYVLTNYHVVDGVARIQVTGAAGRTVIGELIERDAETDLAVIKIPRDEKLQAIKLGTSSDLMVGEPVVALGNAFGYNHTATRGIISALHRDVPVSELQEYFDLIQTDASINPGNSGGPLLNIDGEMIGLNVAVRVGAQGIGFAIPVDQAVDVAARMIRQHNEGQQWHGIVGETSLEASGSVFRITAVEEGSPAAKAGIRAGDVVTTVGELPIQRALDFELALLERKVGDKIALATQRDEQLQAANLLMAEAPDRRVKSVAQQTWEVTGLRLTPVSLDDVQRRTTRYRGGLRVTAVRPGSPAERQNIQPGDILVGIHVWETISLDNIGYVLTQAELDRTRPVKCFILREDRTHYTYLPVGERIRR
jgi:serine protease Do